MTPDQHPNDTAAMLARINAEAERIYREHQLHPALVILRPWPQDVHLGMQIARRVVLPPRAWFEESPSPAEAQRILRQVSIPPAELFHEVIR
jgi:hypothetical protein